MDEARQLKRLRELKDRLLEDLQHVSIFEDELEFADLETSTLTLGDVRFIYGMLWRAEDTLAPKQPAKAV